MHMYCIQVIFVYLFITSAKTARITDFRVFETYTCIQVNVFSLLTQNTTLQLLNLLYTTTLVPGPS